VRRIQLSVMERVGISSDFSLSFSPGQLIIFGCGVSVSSPFLWGVKCVSQDAIEMRCMTHIHVYIPYIQISYIYIYICISIKEYICMKVTQIRARASRGGA